MKATAEIQVIPIGEGVSVRHLVKKAHEILAASGLVVQLHAWGTNVEGEMHDIFAAVERIHQTLHDDGVVRIATAIKIGTRSDKEPTLAGKMF